MQALLHVTLISIFERAHVHVITGHKLTESQLLPHFQLT